VTLPQLRDVLVVITLLRTIWDFKEFDLIYLLTGGGPITSTQTLPLLVYKQAFGLNAMGTASTYAIGMLIVLLTFMILYLARVSREKEPA
jgi:multiple sugar transport system permease protein